MSSFAVRIEPSESQRQIAVNSLFKFGATVVHETDECLLTSFPEGTDLEPLRAMLAEARVTATLEVGRESEFDWASSLHGNVAPHLVGDVYLCPPWVTPSMAAKHTIVIDPAMAFGTGDHESTRTVLALMQRHFPVKGTVADVGAGSGVLAIAAAKLGARTVAAIENDPDAISNLNENLERNGVQDRVAVLDGFGESLLPLLAPLDLIVANIVSSVLSQMLPVMRPVLSPAGTIIVGGLLTAERVTFSELMTNSGWEIVDSEEEGEWCCLAARPRQ